MDTCVVGGGIIGALTAHALAQKGFDVRVLDAGRPGAATPVSAGILFSIFDQASDSAWASLARHGHAAYPKLCAGIESETGFERRGLLIVGMEAKQAEQWARANGLDCEILSPGECHRRFPRLAAPEHDVALMPEVAQIDPPRFMEAFRSKLQDDGVRWESARVSGILQDENQVRGVSNGEQEWQAEQVVIAAGAWSTELQQAAGSEPSIRPRRGQIIAWRSIDAGNLPIVLDGHRYLVVRRTARCWRGRPTRMWDLMWALPRRQKQN